MAAQHSELRERNIAAQHPEFRERNMAAQHSEFRERNMFQAMLDSMWVQAMGSFCCINRREKNNTTRINLAARERPMSTTTRINLAASDIPMSTTIFWVGSSIEAEVLSISRLGGAGAVAQLAADIPLPSVKYDDFFFPVKKRNEFRG
ncbi:hypothetical protein RHGRI_011944 [Rhododendron griersonianum]|uniref:Uncharacterized protein n=1 Tax=Rhododendron griersonianum TaxID=479676 RepID=A0AAV6KP21_9ERIC|nr:hypothetical protein RHGRI_011944 [Rhododendron griersonianum]